MGIYYSSNIGFGFIVDQVKLREYWESLQEEHREWDGPYGAMEEILQPYHKLLSYSSAGGYDQESDFAVGVARLESKPVGRFEGGFGIKTLPADPWLTDDEEVALYNLSIKISVDGDYVFFAAFDQS